MQDESYYTCWQLEGLQDYLISCLNKLCSSDTGLTFASKMHLSGQYEGIFRYFFLIPIRNLLNELTQGKVIIYEENKYPYNCMGPVRYLWKPLDTTTNEKRFLWLWTHPSVFDQIKDQFVKIFNIRSNEDSLTEPPEHKKAKMESDSIKVNDLIIKNDSVKITCLKDKLIRLKLLGPLSTTILSYALKIEDFSNFDQTSAAKWSNNDELTKYYK